MNIDPNFVIRLLGLSQVLDQHTTLEDGLQALARLAADYLGCENCSIMLLQQAEGGESPRLKVYATHGELPEAAYHTSQALNEGIAGRVAAEGKPLLITDLAHSALSDEARQPQDLRRGLMSAPILLGGQVIGVINVKHPADDRIFGQGDLDTLHLFALFAGQSIHVFQLQNVLRSRYLQQAMAAELKESGAAPGPINPDPSRLARIAAKSFYRELTKAGFSPSDIISTATEVISLLHEHLDRHKKRMDRSFR